MQYAPWQDNVILGYGEPSYACANPACDQAAWEEGDYRKCETCGKGFCAECLVTITGIQFCAACAICNACAKPARLLCDKCGDLLCGADARSVERDDAETGYRERAVVCRAGCEVDKPAEGFNSDNCPF